MAANYQMVPVTNKDVGIQKLTWEILTYQQEWGMKGPATRHG
jgi:hypothetical protein